MASQHTRLHAPFQGFQPKSNEEFEGAPMHCFEAAIMINVTNEEEAKQWIHDMMGLSLTE